LKEKGVEKKGERGERRGGERRGEEVSRRFERKDHNSKHLIIVKATCMCFFCAN